MSGGRRGTGTGGARWSCLSTRQVFVSKRELIIHSCNRRVVANAWRAVCLPALLACVTLLAKADRMRRNSNVANAASLTRAEGRRRRRRRRRRLDSL